MPYPSKQGEIVERMELNQLFGTILLAALMFLPVNCAGTVESVKGLVGQKRDRNIHIASKPSGAKVTYDGKFIGTTPTFLRFVEGGDTVGEHVLEVTMEGYIPYRRMFIDRHNIGPVSNDYPLKVVAHLDPLPGGQYWPSPTASHGPSLRLPSRPQKTGAIGQRWAVVVGISRYKHGGSDLANLRYADQDAKAFYEFLISPTGANFPKSNIRFLINEGATLASLKDALYVFLQNAIEEDLVIIYFAGHGSPEPADNENLYLLAYDTDPRRLPSTAFPMWDIETALSRYIRAERVVLIADACHSAGIGSGFATRAITVEGNPVNRYLIQLAKSGRGRAIFTASEAGEQSQESKKWGGGHGVFTYFLLEGLKGKADSNKDGIVSLGESMDYTDEQVRRATQNKQHPDTSGNFDRNLPLSVPH
jgi:uncharacterized caspase-like protein